MFNKSSSMTKLSRTFERVPARVRGASKVLKRWTGRATRMTRERPGRSLIGAFAIGFVLAKVTRIV